MTVVRFHRSWLILAAVAVLATTALMTISLVTQREAWTGGEPGVVLTPAAANATATLTDEPSASPTASEPSAVFPIPGSAGGAGQGGSPTPGSGQGGGTSGKHGAGG